MTEVDNLHHALGAQDDVVGLDVGVDVPALVQGFQPGGHLAHDLQEPVQAIGTGLLEGHALHVLHQHVQLADLHPLADPVDRVAAPQVRVIHLRADGESDLGLGQVAVVLVFTTDHVLEGVDVAGGPLDHLMNGRTGSGADLGKPVIAG